VPLLSPTFIQSQGREPQCLFLRRSSSSSSSARRGWFACVRPARAHCRPSGPLRSAAHQWADTPDKGGIAGAACSRRTIKYATQQQARHADR
jgi:hypothetical protein